jgi:hypothetical protein
VKSEVTFQEHFKSLRDDDAIAILYFLTRNEQSKTRSVGEHISNIYLAQNGKIMTDDSSQFVVGTAFSSYYSATYLLGWWGAITSERLAQQPIPDRAFEKQMRYFVRPAWAAPIEEFLNKLSDDQKLGDAISLFRAMD